MSREFHEKIAAALNALAEAEDTKPVVSGKAPSVMPVEPKKKPKLAEDEAARRYTRLTGEDLPDEVAESPAAMDALRKVASASSPVNELGDPSDRFDRGTGRPTGRTKEARVKEIYASFGDELLKD